MAEPRKTRSAPLIERVTEANVGASLAPKQRNGERLIQLVLLACGFLSIFTTIGIILVLANESFNFFARKQWVDTNKTLTSPIDAEVTSLETSTSGTAVNAGELVRINEEEMRIVSFSQNLITLQKIGTGAGISRMCEGTAVIATASRLISADEQSACEAAGLTPVEFRIGTDALAIVVNSANDFITNATLEELTAIFTTATVWSDVNPAWPNEPIYRVTPGGDSGTLDYMAEAIADGNKDLILNAANVTSEDDAQLVRNIVQNENAIGFFGYSYYLNNQDRLTSLSIEGITPDAESVSAHTYPLSRPLLLYVPRTSLQSRPEVAALIDYSLTFANEAMNAVGYFPEDAEELLAMRERFLDELGYPKTGDYADGQALTPNLNLRALNGDIVVSGSSTVYPAMEAIIGQFHDDGYVSRLGVERGVNGTLPKPHAEGIPLERGEQPTLWEFFTNTLWIPAIGEFGVLPLVNATLLTSFVALLFAIPMGMGAAIFLSEYASENVRKTLKPILEILAGIPTVVYGYFALSFMTPLLQSIFGSNVVNSYNMLSAGLVMGIMLIPLISSMSEDALRAVPRALREASYGLGATKLETVVKVVLPAAVSGIAAAIIVAMSRAVGETMIVALAAGAGPAFTFNLFASAETMTGHISRISGGDLSYDSIDYNSIFAIGMLLFLITLVLNLISRALIERFRERY